MSPAADLDDAAAPTLAAATSVRQTAPDTYTADLSPHWCIGSVPHGGYVAAVLQRVCSLHFGTTLAATEQPHLLALHVEYLRRTAAGRATVRVRAAKVGRQTSTVHLSLSQPRSSPSDRKGEDGGEVEEVTAYATHAHLARIAGPSLATHWRLAAPDPPPRPAAALLADPAGLREDAHWSLAAPAHPRFRTATRRVHWLLPRAPAATSTEGEAPAVMDMWMALASGERWTPDALGFAVDMFPQLLERGAPPGRTAGFWYPTLLLNLDVRRDLAATGGEAWLFLRVASRAVQSGRYDLEVTVLDGEGGLVATSTHVCFAVPAARNVSARGSFKGEGGKL